MEYIAQETGCLWGSWQVKGKGQETAISPIAMNFHFNFIQNAKKF